MLNMTPPSPPAPPCLSVPMSWADIGPKEKEYVNDVLDSGWLSRRKYLPKFEQEVARIHNHPYGLMTNSGTDALRIGLAVLKETYAWRDGDEVIVPSVTFVATVNVVLQNHLTPVFADVDRTTYNITPQEIVKKITTKTRAVIPVHLFGLPADMNSIMALAGVNALRVLEDSCECFGVHEIQGDMAAFSFYMAHHIQTGVGGMLTTGNKIYDTLARSYMNHGRSARTDRFEFERVGYSSRVTEMEAALGCGQLERWQLNIASRKRVADKISEALCQVEAIQYPREHMLRKCSWMLYPMVLKRKSRDDLMAFLLDRGIESRQMMPLLNQPVYRNLAREEDFPVAKWINENGICLPCHPLLTDEQIGYMTGAVKEFFD